MHSPTLTLFLTVSFAWAQAPAEQYFNAKADPEQGKKLWSANCSICHGADGKGGRGSNLTTGKFRYGGTDDDLYRAIRYGIPGTEMPGFPIDGLAALHLIAYVRVLGSASMPALTSGDVARGRELFFGAGQCSGCHHVPSGGSRTGPDLSGVGMRLPPDALMASLLRPGERVMPEYYYVKVVTRDGRTFAGRRLNEDTYSVQLIDTQERLVSFVKDELRSYELIRESPMPSYESKLKLEELSDLVAFLASLRGEQ